MLTWILASVYLAQCVIIITLIGYLFRRRRPKMYPPGPMSLPIIGNLHQLGTRPYVKFLEMKKTYGDIIAIDFASFPGVILNDYKLIREAFNMAEFSGRPALDPFVARCGGDRLRGIIVGTGKQWQEQRRFALKTLRDFGFGKKTAEVLIQDEVQELVQTLSRLNGLPMTTNNLFNVAVVNSLWSIMTGQRFSHDDKKLLNLVKIITEGFSDTPAAGAFMFFPWLSKLAPEASGFNSFVGMSLKALDMVTEQFKEHSASFQPGHPRDYLDVHIQEIQKTTDPASSFYGVEGELNLAITLLDMFLAGTETTSSTLSWLFMYLANSPIQERLYKEIQAVVGQSRLPSLSNKQQMPYTEAILMEVLRISALAPLSIFHETTEDVAFHNYIIPKNTMVISNLYGVLHDPDIWGDPEVFRPERFINPEDGSINRHHEAFLPFSTGKRVCLGESLARDSLFLFTTSIFQKFIVETNPAKPKPDPNDYAGGMLRIPKAHEYVLQDRQ